MSAPGYRGYAQPANYGGRAPQHIQNLVIRLCGEERHAL